MMVITLFFPSPTAPPIRELNTTEDPIGAQDFSSLGDPAKGGVFFFMFNFFLFISIFLFVFFFLFFSFF